MRKLIIVSITLFLLFYFDPNRIQANCQSNTILTTANHHGVDKHNELRAKHGVPNLVLDASITSIAQQYAEYLAANQYFQHSSDAMTGKYGENLYYTCSYPSAPDAASKEKIDIDKNSLKLN